MTSQGTKIVPLAKALELIQDGSNVVAAMAAAEPQALFESIGSRCASLQNVTLHCANPSRAYPCFAEAALLGRLELRVMFLTHSVRRHHGSGRVYYVPQHLSQWVRNLL